MTANATATTTEVTVTAANISDVISTQLVTIGPVVSFEVHLGLTITYTALYTLLFLFVLSQIVMLRVLRSKLISPHSVILYHCLLWCGLRIALFCFYYNNCYDANHLPTPLYWLLYCLPICLQYSMFCVMANFHFRVYLRALALYQEHRLRKGISGAILLSNIIFLVTNLVTAILTYKPKRFEHISKREVSLVLARVIVNDALFFIIGLFTVSCIYMIARSASAHLVLESRGSSKTRAIIVAVLVVILTTSRTLYNFVAVANQGKPLPNFGYDWINITDQSDFTDLSKGYHYIVFGAILLLWEFLPTASLVFFFRAHCPRRSTETAAENQAIIADSQRTYLDSGTVGTLSSVDVTSYPHHINNAGYLSSRSHMSNGSQGHGSFQRPAQGYGRRASLNNISSPNVSNFASSPSYRAHSRIYPTYPHLQVDSRGRLLPQQNGRRGSFQTPGLTNSYGTVNN